MPSLRIAIVTILALSLGACLATGMGQRGGPYGERGARGQRGPGQGGARRAGSIDSGERRTLVVAGVTRTYYFHRGSSAHSPTPLVIVFHGGQGDASKIAGQTGFNDVADRNGFVVAYPEAITNWNDGRNSTAGFGDDTGFVRALINELATKEGIDRSRVYATGPSAGGNMTLKVACDLADQIAAFAPVAASFPDSSMSRCKPARPVPIMIIHGSADHLIPAQGAKIPGGGKRMGGTVQPLTETVDFWRQVDKCRTPPSSTMLPDKSNDGTKVEVNQYQGCASGSQLVFVNIIGGGHTWPDERTQTKSQAGPVCRDIDGSQYIWDFFRAYTLSGAH